jgi:hypothetical protein
MSNVTGDPRQVKTCVKTLLASLYGSSSARLISDSELRAAVRVIWSVGPRSVYEMMREVRDGAEVTPTVHNYVGVQRFVGSLNTRDGRRLRP